MTQTITLTVTGDDPIHCAGCEQRISRVLRRLPGIHKVITSIPRQQIEVTFEPNQINPEQIQAKLGEIGFEVTLEVRT